MLRQIVDLDVTDTGGVVQAPDDGGVGSGVRCAPISGIISLALLTLQTLSWWQASSAPTSKHTN